MILPQPQGALQCAILLDPAKPCEGILRVVRSTFHPHKHRDSFPVNTITASDALLSN